MSPLLSYSNQCLIYSISTTLQGDMEETRGRGEIGENFRERVRVPSTLGAGRRDRQRTARGKNPSADEQVP